MTPQDPPLEPRYLRSGTHISRGQLAPAGKLDTCLASRLARETGVDLPSPPTLHKRRHLAEGGVVLQTPNLDPLWLPGPGGVLGSDTPWPDTQGPWDQAEAALTRQLTALGRR